MAGALADSGTRQNRFWVRGGFLLSYLAKTDAASLRWRDAFMTRYLAALVAGDGVTASQTFAKPCLKINGKAFVAQHREAVVFKLTGAQHLKAAGLTGAVLWDPSGKGRPMKEWVALPASEAKHFKALSGAALAYVSGSAA